jgi:steroid delta-isomerase
MLVRSAHQDIGTPAGAFTCRFAVGRGYRSVGSPRYRHVPEVWVPVAMITAGAFVAKVWTVSFRQGRSITRMTHIRATAQPADAQFVHDQWDARTRAHDIDGLLDLYVPHATLESPLVVRILDQASGVLRGHSELRPFFVRGTQGRPNELVRWYRTGDYMFDGHTLIWEYPRQTPDGDQVDLVEVMELDGARISHHRIYWGWFGAPLLQR